MAFFCVFKCNPTLSLRLIAMIQFMGCVLTTISEKVKGIKINKTSQYGNEDVVTLIQRLLFVLWFRHLCASLDLGV